MVNLGDEQWLTISDSIKGNCPSAEDIKWLGRVNKVRTGVFNLITIDYDVGRF